MRKIERISISNADRERLERFVRDRNTPQKVVWRARIVLLAADVGYQTIFYSWSIWKNILDARMKVGMEFDVLFKFMHGISNTDRCAEGVSPEDEFRIVGTRASPTLRFPFNFGDDPDAYFDAPMKNNFQPMKTIGPYTILTNPTRMELSPGIR